MHRKCSPTLSSKLKFKAERILHCISMYFISTWPRGINSPWMSREERGVAEKARMMLRAREADGGRA